MMKNNRLKLLDTRRFSPWFRTMVLSLVVALSAGCASSGNPRDPLEPVNRAVYSFNDGFDRAIAKPVAQGYKAIVPDLVRTGIGNFFSNLEDLWIAANNLLQGKVATAADDFGRFFLNSTFGFFGVFDIASDVGLEKHNEDFGQTLARWGVGSGPYVVLPFLGPSTVRDALGRMIVDSQADFVIQTDHVPTRNSLLALRAVDTRADLLDASRVLEEAALDKYNFVRDAFLQRRRSLIFDGNPPKEEVSEAEDAGTLPATQQVKDSSASEAGVALASQPAATSN